MADPLTYTIPEAAGVIGISAKTLHRLIKAGTDLPVLRIRGRVLISRAGLARWVDQHTTPASPTPRSTP